KSESLVQGREDEAIRGGIEVLELRGRDPAEKVDVVRHALRAGELAELLLVRSGIAGEHQERPALTRDARDRCDEAREVLVRALRGHAERDSAVAGADELPPGTAVARRAGRLAQPVRDHVDAFARGAREPEQVG